MTLAPEDTACPCCRATMIVIGEDTFGAAGCDPGAVSGDRDQASQARLPRLPGHRGAGAGAAAVDRRRHPDRGAGRAGRWSPAMPIISRCIARRR